MLNTRGALHTDEEKFYPFKQSKMLMTAQDMDGMCASLSTLYIHKLLSHESIDDFTHPNYSALYMQTKQVEDKLVSSERDGENSDTFVFSNLHLKSNTTTQPTNKLEYELANTKAALIKYKTPSGVLHQVAFGSHGFGVCSFFNPNTGTKIGKCTSVLSSLRESLGEINSADILLISTPEAPPQSTQNLS
jgi:hypothetical protein